MENSFKDLCNMRRSVRAFIKEKSVPQEKIQYIRTCVNLAPTACNKQPFRFFEVKDEQGLQQLQSCYKREWLSTAPMCIIACRDTEQEWIRRADEKPHGDIDVAIAVEHLCLAAAEQGLGTCWICNFDTERCKALFNLPDNLVPTALIPIGFAADEATSAKVRKPESEIWEEL